MERDLVLRFKTAREAVASADEALKTAREEERQAEQAVLDYLEGKGASATAKFPEGWVQVNTPRLFASCPVEQQPTLFEWLRAHEQGSAVKETVHSATLSQIVSECLRDGVALPEYVKYFLKPNVRLYGGSHG